MHARQQILEAVIAALKDGVPVAQKRVSEDQDFEVQDTELPAIRVMLEPEQITPQAQLKQRLAQIAVLAAVRAKGPQASIQSQANELAEQIEQTLDGGITVHGARLPMAHVQVETSVSAALSKRIGEIALVYQVKYFTPYGQPGQIRGAAY